MGKTLLSFIEEPEIFFLQKFFSMLVASEHQIILRNDILLSFQEFIANEGEGLSLKSSWRFLRKVQEIIHHSGEKLIMVYRHRRANCRIYALTGKDAELEMLSIREFLVLKESLIKPELSFSNRTMELNLAPFYDYGPNLKDPQTIGNGITHLNRYMSTNLALQPEKWNRTLYEFLKLHNLHGVHLLLDGEMIRDTSELESGLEDAMDFLERCDCGEDSERIKAKLRTFGFLDGWGDSLPRIMETFHLLQDTLEQPNEDTLEEFLTRIPMVSKVTMISPHGWFGQDNVLGRPDTGGQVVYVLDQARAMEKYLTEDLRKSGLLIEPKILIVTRLIPENEGTRSDQRLEKVYGTRNVWILRVPFFDAEGKIMPQWISRFRVWPYLDQFAVDVEREIKAEFQGRPDLIIGNYSDGNLVATQLSKSMGVIQCNIAHALEKSKYLFSDLYWDNFEDEYHFSVQFMADLIAMNLANFIISSTGQEIIGTDESIGQYESYQFFTMPGLMHVISGINLFHPRFNVIPPGVNNDVFFPYHQEKRRQSRQQVAELSRLIFEQEDDDCLGKLENPQLPPIFSIARLDRIKNITGLVEAYGKDEKLRSQANLMIIASVLDPARSKDSEEASEIVKMHDLIKEYKLAGHIRWIGRILATEDTGEVYRIMAERGGVFVQPALFEAFGLTILEAMHSGLPVFATQFGGPLEIIEHNKSGFLINPTDQLAMTARISDFFNHCAGDKEYWSHYSQKGLGRATTYFTWNLHCQKLTMLTKVYGFWRYSISYEAKSRLAQYCQLLYNLFFRERAKKIKN
ncbi:MAG: sucrose synthase [Proteobacteria bacterium]|nr:sucrose synthase [Pseudomonadota bacterium]MBU1716097.1 sucrose synthase [Pseudomonadota bacterium]